MSKYLQFLLETITAML